jgi:hypothetical protein
MNPRINVGKGVTGCVRYVFGEGRDPKTGELLPDPLDGSSRVAWIGSTGFGFNIETREHAELARRIMEFDALNQKGQAQQDCMHLSLIVAAGRAAHPRADGRSGARRLEGARHGQRQGAVCRAR